VVLLGIGCGGEKQEQAANQNNEPPKPIPVVNPENELARAAAEKLIDQFSTELRSELMAAIKQGGAANAVTVCAEIAPKLGKQYAGEGWTIRRATMQPRNNGNYAREGEAHFLEQFQKDSSLTHQAIWDTAPGKRTYRYFRPIYMQQMCTTCHGDLAQMDPAVIAALDKKYPDDRASGYKVGALRGMFSVAAEWPLGKVRAEKLTGATPPN
jgi:hypothetical protein